MASTMYRETEDNFGRAINLAGSLVFDYAPIDADQAPGGYLKSIKLSLQPMDESAGRIDYLVAASSSDNPTAHDDIITAQALHGGGTVWLSLKRRIEQSTQNDDRGDGPVFVHVYSNIAHQANIVSENWGRFINASPR